MDSKSFLRYFTSEMLFKMADVLKMLFPKLLEDSWTIIGFLCYCLEMFNPAFFRQINAVRAQKHIASQ